MKTKYSLLIACLGVMMLSGLSASGQFAWMKGDNSKNQVGVYGTKGSYNSANKPGGRWGCTTWRDGNGIFWLFGGEGYGASGGTGRLNDLWKYDPTTNQWMWVLGDSVIDKNGVYGTKGTAAASNNPGSREVAVNWMDNSGIFWTFGGYGRANSGGNTYLNDLWKYDASANQWTWMSGDSTGAVKGVYGTKGTEASSNKPGGRYHSVGTLDASGNLLLFSGLGYARSTTTPSNMNDLWKYNLSNGYWTWLSGDSVVNLSGVFGTLGVAASTNKPGARVHGASWTDTNGNFWVFCGNGKASTGSVGYLNDLWKYDMSTGYWTWMSGDNIVNQTGVYSDSCSATPGNKPGGRQAPVYWLDPNSGLFWLYGGSGRNAATTLGELDDLWAYDMVTNEWSWIRGSSININGVYGTQGVGNWGNKPGGRNHSAGWHDDGSLWMFGGSGYPATGVSGFLNDLWQLPFASPCSGSPLPVKVSDFGANVTHDNSQVKIQWITHSEVNNAYFTVERSVNGSQFEKIITVAAAGNSTVQHNYEIIDGHPLYGTSYYRLASTSYNGTYRIEGKMVAVTIKRNPNAPLNLLTIYPNPLTAKAQVIHFVLPETSYAEFNISIINKSGQKLMGQNFVPDADGISAGHFQLPSGFKSGIYHILCSGKGFIYKNNLAVFDE